LVNWNILLANILNSKERKGSNGEWIRKKVLTLKYLSLKYMYAYVKLIFIF